MFVHLMFKSVIKAKNCCELSNMNQVLREFFKYFDHLNLNIGLFRTTLGHFGSYFGDPGPMAHRPAASVPDGSAPFARLDLCPGRSRVGQTIPKGGVNNILWLFSK